MRSHHTSNGQRAQGMRSHLESNGQRALKQYTHKVKPSVDRSKSPSVVFETLGGMQGGGMRSHVPYYMGKTKRWQGQLCASPLWPARPVFAPCGLQDQKQSSACSLWSAKPSDMLGIRSHANALNVRNRA
jgi:hypothetical protein